MEKQCIHDRASLETQGFKVDGDRKETVSEKNEEKEGGGGRGREGKRGRPFLPLPLAPPFSSFFSLPFSFPPPSQWKPWVSEDDDRGAIKITSLLKTLTNLNQWQFVSDYMTLFSDHILPPFALISDFRNQNTGENVSKISVNHTCYCQTSSKSTNHSPLAWREEGKKVTLGAVIGGFRSDLSITHKTDGNLGNILRVFWVWIQTVVRIKLLWKIFNSTFATLPILTVTGTMLLAPSK